ncbi:MAG: response regulator [Verrucomicrobia bacterium]|nr:response regulator [Verrucomicrobiota bacterium]
MKTILVLAQNPELPDAIKSALDGHAYRLLVRQDVEEAEPLLRSGSFHACVIDADHPQIHLVWILDRLKDLAPKLPILASTQTRSPELEEALHIQGVARILTKPIRPRLLRHFLDQFQTLTSPHASAAASPPSHELRRPPVARELPQLTPIRREPPELTTITSVLPHAFSVTALSTELLPRLRRILGIHRASLLLRPAHAASQPIPSDLDERTLSMIGSSGLPLHPKEQVRLSLDSGLGAILLEGIPIIRRGDLSGAALDEMDLLGGDVAVAVMHSGQLVGVLTLSTRVSGESLAQETVESLFFLSEQIGAAVTQIWSQERVVANHGMMEGILRELSSACVVVGRDLQILHSNHAARSMFLAPADASAPMHFKDLPPLLANRVFQVLKQGQPAPAFRFRFPEGSSRNFQAAIVPFQSKNSLLPMSALIVLDDQSQGEQLRKLEVEASNLRLVRIMADRLAHEIGNALVPVSTHQQLLSTRHKDAEFRASLETALANSVKRIGRLVNQMVFLAQDRPVVVESNLVVPLIEEAFREAQRHLPNQTASIRFNADQSDLSVLGDAQALRHALSEVLMNAIHANPTEARISIKISATLLANDSPAVAIEVKDNGEGFGSDGLAHATDAFFTTRSVGLGLGLTVAKKVVEAHQGRLEILPNEPRQGGVVRFTLPAAERRLL